MNYEKEILKQLKDGPKATSQILNGIGWDRKRASKEFMKALRSLESRKIIYGEPIKELNYCVVWMIIDKKKEE